MDLLTDADNFSLIQRVGRIGTVTVSEFVLDADVSLDAGEVCGAYRIVVPLSGRTESLYRDSHLITEPGVVYTMLNQPLVGLPFVDSLVRGFLLAADHPHRCSLVIGERLDALRATRTAVEIVEEEADSPLTLSSIAARCHTSVRSLQQAFQRHLGTTPMQYLREVRLRRAHRMLVSSDPSAVTVASVANRWGFSHPGRFAAVHARRYGETPTETLRRRASSSATFQGSASAPSRSLGEGVGDLVGGLHFG